MAGVLQLLFDCDDDEEDDIRAKKIYKVRRDAVEKNFRQLYRFTPENVQALLNYFMPQSEETRGGALTSEQSMKAFLRYIGDPGFQVIGLCKNREYSEIYK